MFDERLCPLAECITGGICENSKQQQRLHTDLTPPAGRLEVCRLGVIKSMLCFFQAFYGETSLQQMSEGEMW